MPYATPIRDMRYALDHMAGFKAVVDTGAYEDLSEDLVEAIMTEMGKYCDGEVAPLNWTSNIEGAKLENGVVRTSSGFADAYKQFVESGWGALSFPPEVGGQGLPHTLNATMMEGLNAASMSFALCSMLTGGATKAIMHAGTDEQKALYVGKMVSGEWTGAMNLTEPQAGSDLSDMRTKAEPVGDGRYKISGQKIYITYGDHDMADNIVHLVLARLPDAPEGTGGISMFLVPKYHVGEDGSLGEGNDVQCVGLEEKLGIHGSPTCVMSFGENNECYGTLLGQENKGLRNMFIMMNSARLDVGLQGVGVSERAFQQALEYAMDRRQGRAPGVRAGDQIPIYDHPDVRRMLYAMKSMTEAARGICYANAVASDLAHSAPDEETRREAKALEELLTPISKAWASDRANEATSLGVQIHGGMGFVEETGAAQHMRDARIAAIYEGTNGIQAMDLVGRKLQGDGGAAANRLIEDIYETASAAKAATRADIVGIGVKLAEAAAALKASTDWVLESTKTGQEDALASAWPYLKQFGNVAGGFYLTRGAIASAAAAEAGGDDKAYHESKIAIARFFADNYLAEAVGLTPTVMAGAQSVDRVDPELLTA
ncbi:MAG: acyl-CoA dehydrogenase [Pseudomonadota bacterium]